MKQKLRIPKQDMSYKITTQLQRSSADLLGTLKPKSSIRSFREERGAAANKSTSRCS